LLSFQQSPHASAPLHRNARRQCQHNRIKVFAMPGRTAHQPDSFSGTTRMAKRDTIGESFVGLLMSDVVAMIDNLAVQDNQLSRRSLVRATFAAIEGIAWICREHVYEIARTMGDLTPLSDLALRDRNFVITEHGKILEQTRYLTLPAAVRLTIEQAKLINPDFDVKFDDKGWQRFRKSIEIRNRITHPKTASDYSISDLDLRAVSDGLIWILILVRKIMSETNAAFATHASALAAFHEQLQKGDDAAFKIYNNLLDPDAESNHS
jgi:hypothetical protein